ncbi:N-acetylmuramoyl-L-alanine amidase [Peptacetobacter sp.]|uniref:N-acetylmuramoyl-L-alanine amidase n=1 Tax=Peptacetobacter sp. TaxID=2991975 RepID=UPI003AB78F9C
MKFNISAGHNPDGKIACGTVNNTLNMKESTEARYQTKKVVEYLKADGNHANNCTVDNGTGQTDVLNKLVAKHNSHSVDWDVSIHFNDTDKKDLKGDGKNVGVEVWYYNNTNTAKREECRKKAELVCENLSKIGFKNRGAKPTTSLKFLRKTNAKAILIEVCFCSDADDVKLYKSSRDNIARAIADALEGKKYVKRDNKMDKVIAYVGDVDEVAATVLNWKLKDYILKDANSIKGKSITNLIVVGGGAEKVFPAAKTKLVGKDRFETVQKVLDYIK